RAGIAGMQVVRNGIRVRPPVREPGAPPAARDLPAGARIVLTVGRFSPQKGYRDLAAAIPAILARVPTAQFLWVGSGPLEAELRAAIATAGLAGVVHFLGRRPDVDQLLAGAAV